jgi:hypothetical protein
MAVNELIQKYKVTREHLKRMYMDPDPDICVAVAVLVAGEAIMGMLQDVLFKLARGKRDE